MDQRRLPQLLTTALWTASSHDPQLLGSLVLANVVLWTLSLHLGAGAQEAAAPEAPLPTQNLTPLIPYKSS